MGKLVGLNGKPIAAPEQVVRKWPETRLEKLAFLYAAMSEASAVRTMIARGATMEIAVEGIQRAATPEEIRAILGQIEVNGLRAFDELVQSTPPRYVTAEG